MSSTDPPASTEADGCFRPPETGPLPRRAWISLGALLVVQTQNAFNDNFVKFILTGLAMAVAAKTPVGKNIEFILAAMIPLPFILFAPVAGYLSDRFSKSRVVLACLVLQFVLFAFIAAAVALRSVEAAVFGFFLLAVQSTLFSPAKQGILKELVGSSRLGLANGLISMLAMLGILGGMWLAGQWFDHLLAKENALRGVDADNGWRAALLPVIGAGAACAVALFLARFIQRTPDHPSEAFTRGVWVRHFRHLRQLLEERLLRFAALYITAYWFIANFLGLSFVQFAKELFPDASQEGRMSAVATMLFCVGGGLVLGSSLVSYLSRHRIRLGLSPWGGAGIALGLAGAGCFGPAGSWWGLAPGFILSLGFIGFSSGFYVVPLNAWLQDLAREDHRARVISALNLMTSFSGIVAILVGLGLKGVGLSASQQALAFSPFLVAVCLLLARSLRNERRAA